MTNISEINGYGIYAQTASLANTASLAVSSSYALTSSLALTSSFTPNALITASVSLNTITFTKGNGSTFPITVDTGSGGSADGGTNLGLVYAISLGYIMP